MATGSSLDIRWMLQDDINDVMLIEKECFTIPWQKKDFQTCLAKKSIVCIVAKISGRIIGFIIYERMKKRLQLLNLAIHPKYRRRGIASTLIKKVTTRKEDDACIIVAAEVRESNLSCQLLLKNCGFIASQILPKYYVDTEEDAYEFLYELPK